MNRRSFLAAAVVMPLLAALAACNDSNKSTASKSPPASDTEPPTPAGAIIAHGTGAADVVLKLSFEGGLVPAGSAVLNIPALLVTGDDHVYTPGVQSSIVPGPLLPSVLVRTVTKPGLQALLAIVQRAGLLAAPPDYTGGTAVADGQTTVLTINAGGGTFVHSAYALGADQPESAARKTLLDVVTALTDVERAIGEASFTANQPFVPTAYRVQARVADRVGTDQGSVVDWPGETSEPLANAATCVQVDAAAIGSLLVDANQNTTFKDAGVVYQLSAVGVLPGDPPC